MFCLLLSLLVVYLVLKPCNDNLTSNRGWCLRHANIIGWMSDMWLGYIQFPSVLDLQCEMYQVIRFTCHSTGCYLPCGCAKSGHFHSCCPSPVLNILLEILWKIVYIAIHECVILVILHIFKMSYQLRNIEQCYLPGKMADNMHSHKKSDPTSCPVSALLPPQLLLLFESFLSGFTSLSCKSTFCAVSGCF